MQMNQPAPAPRAQRRGPLRFFARLAIFPLGLLAYLSIIFEEWLWDRAKRAMAALGRLPWVHRIENALANAPPWIAACAFLIPGALLFPFKIAGLYLIAHGHAALGGCVFLAAKAIGAAALARVWSLTESALRTIAWLSRSIDWIIDKKNQLKLWLSGLWAIRAARAAIHRLLSGARSFQARYMSKMWGKAKIAAEKSRKDAP